MTTVVRKPREVAAVVRRGRGWRSTRVGGHGQRVRAGKRSGMVNLAIGGQIGVVVHGWWTCQFHRAPGTCRRQVPGCRKGRAGTVDAMGRGWPW